MKTTDIFKPISDIIKTTKISSPILNGLKTLKFKSYEARPEILLTVGLMSIIAATVTACIKTRDAETVISHHKESLNDLDYVKNNPIAEEKPTVRQYATVYAKAATDICKVYAGPVALMVGGCLCVIGAHTDMRHRNAKLLADVTAIQALFYDYRERVKAAVGEENERDIFFGGKTEKNEVIEIDPNGIEHKKTQSVTYFNDGPGSMYARDYTPETSTEYDCRSYAEYFLNAKIQHLNWELRTVPFITLNEVYDALGFKNGYGKCPEGMTVGWVSNPKIDRGDREIIVEKLIGKRPIYDAVTGEIIRYEDCLRLDFNCYPLEGLI